MARQRRDDLHHTQKMNLKLNAGVKARNDAERQEWFNEKNKIQTSLKSKEEDERNEQMRNTMRKAALMDMCNVNIDGQKALTQTVNMGRSTKLADDKRWLDAINEAQRHESDFHEYQRKMRVADLR